MSKIAIIGILIALASIYGLILHQINIRIALLIGDLDEETYTEQLHRFVLLK